MTPRPFRFGLSVGGEGGADGLRATAREAEAIGYDVLQLSDHLAHGAWSPMLACLAAADVTERLRVGTYVLNNDLRHPALVAREAATLGALTGGRFELGLGAGHMKSEYDQVGIGFDSAAERVDRLAEAVEVIRSLLDGEEVHFAGRHHCIDGHRIWPEPTPATRVPLLVGGNGQRVLAIGARRADQVGLVGFHHDPTASAVHLSHFTAAGLEAKVAHVRRSAEEVGRDPDEVELSALVQLVVVTSDRRAAAGRLAQHITQLTPEEILESPFLLVGTAGELAEQLLERRERFGIATWVAFATRPGATDQQPSTLAPVIERLKGA